ncbi:MAG TPA: hypothetical protein VGR57_15225 [Ktedonobacterales bacterium]|nr:hypothetical protein [Ktedonobacterales bacterium]
MLQRLLAGGDPHGGVAFGLLGAIGAGYPVERLRPLLVSEDDTALEAAAFILSELGGIGHALHADVAPLLTHRSRRVRADALEIVSDCATPQDGAILAQAVLLTDDPESSVQREALRFLTALASPSLEAARAALPERFRALVRWLLDTDVSAASPEEMRTLLRDPDPLQRRFAAVALARSRNRAALLALADEISDPLIQDFVRTLTLRSPMAPWTG